MFGSPPPSTQRVHEWELREETERMMKEGERWPGPSPKIYDRSPPLNAMSLTQKVNFGSCWSRICYMQ